MFGEYRPHLLVKLDRGFILYAHKKINEPGVLVIPDLLECF
jgi:hypothetical protein